MFPTELSAHYNKLTVGMFIKLNRINSKIYFSFIQATFLSLCWPQVSLQTGHVSLHHKTDLMWCCGFDCCTGDWTNLQSAKTEDVIQVTYLDDLIETIFSFILGLNVLKVTHEQIPVS